MASPIPFLEQIQKFGTLISLILIAYLQTLFPSKTDFDKLSTRFSEVDKKITELGYLQITINQQQVKLADIEVRLRQLEIDIVKLKSEVQLKITKGN